MHTFNAYIPYTHTLIRHPSLSPQNPTKKRKLSIRGINSTKTKTLIEERKGKRKAWSKTERTNNKQMVNKACPNSPKKKMKRRYLLARYFSTVSSPPSEMIHSSGFWISISCMIPTPLPISLLIPKHGHDWKLMLLLCLSNAHTEISQPSDWLFPS